jgi:hypothetical protein
MVTTAILSAVFPVCTFADNCVFPPNPVGEALYRQQLNRELPLPLGVIVAAFLGAWAVRKFRGRTKIEGPSDPSELPAQDRVRASDAPLGTGDASDTILQQFGFLDLSVGTTPREPSWP